MLIAIIVMIIKGYPSIKEGYPPMNKKKAKKNKYYNYKLYLENGQLLLEDKNVIIVHWDNNIYKIYNKNNKFIRRIDKGNNMLFLSTRSNLKNNNERIGDK